MTEISTNDSPILDRIQELILMMGVSPDTYEGELIVQLIQTSLKLTRDKIELGQLKLITRAMKEIRYAYRTFSQYPETRKVSIFGSARTPENHPDYLAAIQFSKLMADAGWTCITGGANGIMKAGLEGAHQERRFGLSIRLPFETIANSHIENDPKLIMFKYFFTRKLMFVSHSDAFAAFPGGFGTMDELYEVLTLIQTGKSEILPLVLIEGAKGDYWEQWEKYVQKHLLANGWISPDDCKLYFRAKSVKEASDHIQNFYSNYHSSRYVGDLFVIRLNRPLPLKKLASLSKRYAKLIESGSIEVSDPLKEETDHLDKFRIVFKHTRREIGLLRALIDDING